MKTFFAITLAACCLVATPLLADDTTGIGDLGGRWSNWRGNFERYSVGRDEGVECCYVNVLNPRNNSPFLSLMSERRRILPTPPAPSTLTFGLEAKWLSGPKDFVLRISSDGVLSNKTDFVETQCQATSNWAPYSAKYTNWIGTWTRCDIGVTRGQHILFRKAAFTQSDATATAPAPRSPWFPVR